MYKSFHVVVDKHGLCTVALAISTSSSSPNVISAVLFTGSTVLNVYLPCLCGALAYVAIFYKLSKQGRQQPHRGPQTAGTTKVISASSPKRHLQSQLSSSADDLRRLRAVKLMAWSYLLTTCCLVPIPTVGLCRTIFPHLLETMWFALTFRTLTLLMPCVNPLIYVLIMPDMRHVYRYLFRKVF